MLTREEANILNHKMQGWMYEKDCICVTRWEKMIQLINELTEKSKREIEIGDIVLDNNGTPHKICKINKDADYCYETINTAYTSKGESHNGKISLDLSKKYKLTEVNDVD